MSIPIAMKVKPHPVTRKAWLDKSINAASLLKHKAKYLAHISMTSVITKHIAAEIPVAVRSVLRTLRKFLAP